MKNLSDQMFINQLRQRLWAHQGLGRAAVMVGAGFSRNADALGPVTPMFPLWKELSRAMAMDLYPWAVDANANKDALRLATEYESVLGRDALNALIARVIPDSDYNPGQLHRMLLSLPWSDVFTTNYDTLLERTLPEVHERKYDLVLTPTDLPVRVKPRIVKLHGSFPSHLPFIVTQEDFRTYPRNFAPFVNTVQQSIIENAFCLLGFSGEDPNFLHWTGWVRDHLGVLSPPIYFCSLFEISPSERRVLEKRHVFPIDLSQVIDRSEIPDDNVRFAKTLEWFLLELWRGAPLNNLNFPQLERQNQWVVSDNVPLSSNLAGALETDLGPVSLSSFRATTEELQTISKRWQTQRERYPGWVVLPNANRERLWHYTQYWINPVLHALDKLPVPEKLALLYELNWRLEKCLLPIPNEGAAEKYRQITSCFNPFPTLLPQRSEFRPDNEAGQNLKWSEISRVWTELVFALMRYAREQFDDAGFQKYVEKLQPIVQQNDDWRARWCYEQALFALFRFKHEAVRNILHKWNKNLGDSFWRVKRAAVLAEIGEIEAAEEQAETALARIRAHQQPFTDDYTLFSQEGWTLLLLKGIKDNQRWGTHTPNSAYRDRWERLAIYRCAPWADLETFELKVKNLDPRPKPAKTTVRGFSPNEETVSYTLFGLGSDEPEKARLALSFLRLFEEAGLPFRSHQVTNFAEAVKKAAMCLATSDLEQTISTIVRVEQADEMNQWFHRHHVAALSQELVNRFFDLFSASFINAAERYQQSPGREAKGTSLRRIKLFGELLSRLCFRLSSTQRETVFSYAEQIYKHPLFARTLWLHETVKVLFKRVLEVMPPADVLERMNRLLALPLPTEGGFKVAETQTWMEPLERISWRLDFQLPSDFDCSTWQPAVEKLLIIARNGTPEARGRALIRLAELHYIKALTDEATTQFAHAIWSRTDPQTQLPSATGFEMWSFLCSLPHPNTEETKNLLRLYLTSQDFPRTVHHHINPDGQPSTSVGLGRGAHSVLTNIIHATLQSYSTAEEREKLIDWSAEETKGFLNKAVVWWDEEKAALQQFATGGMSGDQIRQQFLQLAELFALVLLPRFAHAEAETKDVVKRILHEMEAENLFPLSARPSKLFIVPEEASTVFSQMLTGLRSAQEETVKEAAHGTRNWLFYAHTSGLAECPARLLDELISCAVLRRQPGLLYVLMTLPWIVRVMPEILAVKHLEDLATALEWLQTEAFASFEASDETQQIIRGDEQAAFQNSCQRLAQAIKQHYENGSQPLPNSVGFWVSHR